MKFTEKAFNIFYIVFTLIIFGLSFLADRFLPESVKYENYPYLLLYFFAFTSIIVKILQRKLEISANQFIRTFLVITTVKLLLNSMIAVVFAFTHRVEARGFLVFFLAYYLIFTLVEVIAISQRKK